MDRVAVFVDAGYLFAQGSIAVAGTRAPRSRVDLDETTAINELAELASRVSGGLPLLRIYWYDAAPYTTGATAQQALLAHRDHIKLRLGFMNMVGKQKGVDALIITDMIDLARNRAMTDAVLLSGDEDLRTGVQVAQSFGVRVHLLGITPSRGSQSKLLHQEADTAGEWDAATVAKFLSVRPAPAVAAAVAPLSSRTGVDPKVAKEQSDKVVKVVSDLVASLTEDEITRLTVLWKTERSVPPEYDGKLLARSRDELGRDLVPEERQGIRNQFTEKVFFRASEKLRSRRALASSGGGKPADELRRQ